MLQKHGQTFLYNSGRSWKPAEEITQRWEQGLASPAAHRRPKLGIQCVKMHQHCLKFPFNLSTSSTSIQMIFELFRVRSFHRWVQRLLFQLTKLSCCMSFSCILTPECMGTKQTLPRKVPWNKTKHQVKKQLVISRLSHLRCSFPPSKVLALYLRSDYSTDEQNLSKLQPRLNSAAVPISEATNTSTDHMNLIRTQWALTTDHIIIKHLLLWLHGHHHPGKHDYC